MISFSARVVDKKVTYIQYVHEKCGHKQIFYTGTKPWICQEAGCFERLPEITLLYGKKGLANRIEYHLKHEVSPDRFNTGLNRGWE